MERKEIISRLRNSLKEVSADSRFTNRYLWNVFHTTTKQLIKEDADRGRLYNQSNIWQRICVEMEPVSSIYCDCEYIPYDCTVYRSKKKLPLILESSDGLVYRFIATPDLSRYFTLVSPFAYSTKSKIKYNKTHYVFIHNGYLYMPSDTYPLLIISGVFESDIREYQCGDEDANNQGCGSALSVSVTLSDYLLNAAIKMSLQELTIPRQLPQDEHPNANSTQIQGSP